MAVVTLFAAFLAGSVPFGLLLARARGVDLSAVGSGNTGATNTGRALGTTMGVLTFLLDGSKGVLGVWLGGLAATAWSPAAGGVLAVLGHCYSPFQGFRGGKGVAAAVGAVGVLAPGVVLAGAGGWIVVMVLTRMMSLSCLVMASLWPVALALGSGESGSGMPVQAALCFLPAFFLWTHRENIARMRSGTENRLGGTGS